MFLSKFSSKYYLDLQRSDSTLANHCPIPFFQWDRIGGKGEIQTFPRHRYASLQSNSKL